MVNKYDIIVIMLVITLSTIIIMKKILNDKLTNIEIKIPEIEIPQPNIIVKVQRECNSDKFDVHVQKENDIKVPKKIVGLSPSDKNITQVRNIEEFDNLIPYVEKNNVDTFFGKNFPDVSNTIKFNVDPVNNNLWTDSNEMKKYNDDTIRAIIEADSNYMENRKLIPPSLDNQIIRGGNIQQYNKYSGLDEIGKPLVNKNKFIYPKPTNYLFTTNGI